MPGGKTALPVDQHMLLALAAPRPLYVASADQDLWADPRGEFLSLAHTSPVYVLWNEPAIGEEDMPPLERPLVAGRRGTMYAPVRTTSRRMTGIDLPILPTKSGGSAAHGSCSSRRLAVFGAPSLDGYG